MADIGHTLKMQIRFMLSWEADFRKLLVFSTKALVYQKNRNI